MLQTKEKIRELELYPNPNNGKFKVKLNHFSGMVYLEVMDLFGKTIYSQASDKSNYDFDLSDQQKGIYFVKVTVGTNIFNQKIIYQ